MTGFCAEVGGSSPAWRSIKNKPETEDCAMSGEVKQAKFEIEPLEERIAPSTITTGGGTTTTTGGNQNFFFVGYDPGPGQNGNVHPFHVNAY